MDGLALENRILFGGKVNNLLCHSQDKYSALLKLCKVLKVLKLSQIFLLLM